MAMIQIIATYPGGTLVPGRHHHVVIIFDGQLKLQVR